eukprot:Pgem_evm1s2085
MFKINFIIFLCLLPLSVLGLRLLNNNNNNNVIHDNDNQNFYFEQPISINSDILITLPKRDSNKTDNVSVNETRGQHKFLGFDTCRACMRIGGIVESA